MHYIDYKGLIGKGAFLHKKKVKMLNTSPISMQEMKQIREQSIEQVKDKLFMYVSTEVAKRFMFYGMRVYMIING